MLALKSSAVESSDAGLGFEESDTAPSIPSPVRRRLRRMNRIVNAEASSATATATPITMPAMAPPESGFEGPADVDPESEVGEEDEVVVTITRVELIGMLEVPDIDALLCELAVGATAFEGVEIRALDEPSDGDAVTGRYNIPEVEYSLSGSAETIQEGSSSVDGIW